MCSKHAKLSAKSHGQKQIHFKRLVHARSWNFDCCNRVAKVQGLIAFARVLRGTCFGFCGNVIRSFNFAGTALFAAVVTFCLQGTDYEWKCLMQN